LSSLWGFYYCLLLLDTTNDYAALETIIIRSEDGVQLHKNSSLLTKSLDPLTLARVYFALNEFTKAENYFTQAIQGIQKANKLHHAPPFYLYRANFYFTQNQLDPALADLNSAWEIIERCGMKLYAVDYLLIHGRYSLATDDFDTALNHYIEAKQLIDEIGYHLRDAELDLFAAQLRQQYGEAYREANLSLYSKPPEYYLQKARLRIEEIGQWGLLRVIERDFPGM